MAAHFGLDLGSYSIKAVQLKKKKDTYQLLSLGEVKTPVSLNSSAEDDKKTITKAISKLTKEAKIKTKNVILSLPENKVYSQVIDIPYLNKKEIEPAINFEAEKYIPVPLQEVELEYLILTPVNKKQPPQRVKILLVAARKDAIDYIFSLSQMANLKPIALETEILSLARLVKFVYHHNCIILDLGHSSSDIALLVDQQINLVRSIDTGGEALTRALSQKLDMEFDQAEEYKKTYGFQQQVLEGTVARGLEPILNIIINELKKVVEIFQQQNQQGELKTIIVSGGGALMPGIANTLVKTTNLEVITLDPFKNFLDKDKFKNIQRKASFSTAVGLAMREK